MAVRSALIDALAGLNEDAPLPVAAYTFASAGVPVFPCAPDGKQPLIRDGRGLHDATTDPRRVEAWWSRFPTANIGVPTGTVSGLAVVDVDVHGVNGYDAFRRARRAGLVNGWEALVRTPTDGLHVYYPAPAEGGQRSWQAGDAGVDFRGDGGYIIVPPSRRMIDGETRRYRLATVSPTEGRMLDATGLRNFLAPPRPPRRVIATRDTATLEDARRIASWLGTQTTDRNLKLFWAACRLAEGNVPVADALDALVTVEQPDFGVREITRTVHSAYRTVSTAPRDHAGVGRRPSRTPGRPQEVMFEPAETQTPVPGARGLG